MKRTLTILSFFALLLAFMAGSAFGNDADATAKSAESDKAITTAKAAPAPFVKAASPSLDQPDKLNGAELAMSCKADVNGFDAGYCLGVVEGVLYSLKVCKQDHSVITLGEAADAVGVYLSDHSDKLNERDVVVARKALSKAFPCGVFRR